MDVPTSAQTLDGLKRQPIVEIELAQFIVRADNPSPRTSLAPRFGARCKIWVEHIRTIAQLPALSCSAARPLGYVSSMEMAGEILGSVLGSELASYSGRRTAQYGGNVDGAAHCNPM